MLRAAIFFLVASLIAWPVAAAPAIEVAPAAVIEGQPAAVRFSGLRPGQRVVLHVSRMWDRYPAAQEAFRGRATFVADAGGRIDVSAAAPQPGSSWSRPDAAGPFWSMVPVRRAPELAAQAQAAGSSDPTGLKAGEVRLELEVDGRVVAAAMVRIGAAGGVRMREVREPGVTGVFARGPQPGRQPALILLGGSEGGLFTARQMAPLLASHGYAVLGVGYFQGGEPDLTRLPANLALIPLETLADARAWLAAQPDVDADRIAVVGVSKGAEFGLAASAVYPWIDAVAAFAPSHVVWEGIPPEDRPQGPAGSSWTLAGRPMPYLRWSYEAAARGDAARQATGSSRLTDVHLQSLSQYAADIAAAEIRVERGCAALFLVAGADDAMWPSADSVRRIAARLEAADYRPPVQVEIVDTGHLVLGTGWAPTTAFQRTTGMLQGGIRSSTRPRRPACGRGCWHSWMARWALDPARTPEPSAVADLA